MDFLRGSRVAFGLRASSRLSVRKSLSALTLAALVLAVLAAGASASGAWLLQAAPVSPAIAGEGALTSAAPSAHGRAKIHLAALMRRQHSESRISLRKSSTTPYWACPESFCDAIVDPRPVRIAADRSIRFAMPDGGPAFEGGGEEGGIDPQELRAAYDVPATGGEGQTVALIEEAGYKEAEKDLAHYRSRYGLSPCTKKNGCFRHINPQGGKPRNRLVSSGWETETALDLDMVSAACPSCHILLVDEAASLKELGEAVDTAVTQGATEVSNSYGLPEQGCEKECEATFADYDHRGVPIMVSAGDRGYDNNQSNDSSPNYPATLPAVVAVGGTSLKKAANARGWSEEVWGEPERAVGTGSGCASPLVGGKPYWQTDAGCTGRSDNDVAAVGACITPVSTYESAEGGWRLVCGTSVSSPLVAGIEAHADAFARSLPGADAFYHDPAALFDVTAGSNGVCSSPPGYEDLCNAGVGWDGPSGNGTPDGPLELTGLAPNAHTEPATAVTSTGATLNGKVEASGLPTTYRFEYGTSTAYGSSAPLPEGSAGSGTAAQAVSDTVGELHANSIYHYRLVATNSEGTAYGVDQEFDTAAPVVTEVSPSSGGRAGYRPAQITGANFVNVTSVSFGSTSTSFTVNSPTSITANVPVGEKEGAVNVTVTTPAGQSAAGPADEYTYALGGMLAWGHDEGDLGRGFDGSFSDVPVEVSGELPEVKQVAANSFGSAALLADGEVMTWGEGAHGDLGDGRYELQDTPVKVCAVGVSECPDGPYLQDVAQLVSGNAYSLALLDNGTVVGWGKDKLGQLGGGTPANFVGVPTPVAVCAVVEEPCSTENLLKEVTQIAAGNETSYALLKNATVLAWGANGLEGALGDGKAAYEEYSRAAVQVKGLSGVTSIAADGYGGLAALENGTVQAWGSNEYGTLGNGTKAEASDIPVPVCSGTGKKSCGADLSEVSAVYGASNTSYALLRNGSVMAWGSNNRNSLGNAGHAAGPETCKVGIEREKEPCSRTPIDVDISEVSQLATGQGSANVLALLKNGELMTWGPGQDGDLGGGHSEFGIATPEHICAAYSSGPCPPGPYLSGEVLAMAVGGSHDLVYDRR
jgi:alpha-tubulin suppressor-like RCC1 family protein